MRRVLWVGRVDKEIGQPRDEREAQEATRRASDDEFTKRIEAAPASADTAKSGW